MAGCSSIKFRNDVRARRRARRSRRGPARQANANLKAYAAATLPTLEQHLQMAKQIDAALKSSER
jgi:hypothetical protein